MPGSRRRAAMTISATPRTAAGVESDDPPRCRILRADASHSGRGCSCLRFPRGRHRRASRVGDHQKARDYTVARSFFDALQTKGDRDDGVRRNTGAAPMLKRDPPFARHRACDIPLKIVVADDLPASALALLRSEPDWTVDARTGRAPADLARALADADALLIRSATKVDLALLEAAPRLKIAAGLGVDLRSLDALCAAADYLTVHLPSTADTKHLFNDERFSRCKAGLRFINTARGELVDERALQRAIAAGIVAAAALDVFEVEPPQDWSVAKLPQVIATPHIAASTEEAQELVGLETAASVRDFLRDGMVRNAINFPSVDADELQRLQPWIRLADRLASAVAQMAAARVQGLV